LMVLGLAVKSLILGAVMVGVGVLGLHATSTSRNKQAREK
jgi:hypothetical protein